MIKAVIFDMDGTLIDSEMIWAKHEFKRFTELIPGWNKEDQKRLAGRSIEDNYKMIHTEYGLDVSLEEYYGYYREMAKVVYGEESSLNPGALELVQAFRELGMKTALATSTMGELVELILGRFQLRELFPVIVTSTEAGGVGKPAPDIYLKTLELLGISADEAITFEDTPNGIKAARAAGIYCVGYVSDPSYDRGQADQVITDFRDLDPRALLDQAE